MTMPTTLPDFHDMQADLLRDLIKIAEEILARKGSCLDLIEPLGLLSHAVAFNRDRVATFGSALPKNYVTDTETILCLALKAIAAAAPVGRGALVNVRYREIANQALCLTRENYFAAWHENPKGPPR